MKKLICVKDVENAQKEGRKVIYIDNNTIVTPSAKDAARNIGIEFSTEQPISVCKENICEIKPSEAKVCDDEIDSEMIYKVLRALMDKGLLNGVMDILSNKPYVSEVDSTGLKVVRGSSVRYEALDTGNSNNKVFYQEIINSKDGSSMNAGFITIEDCNFDWETACQEIYYVVEGTLTVKAGEKVYTANPGDSVFFPKGVKITFGSPNKMKAFYVTY
ncbi:ethanolamine utilization protein EutQ [Caloramator quimbayensis]|uniref:Ethanolamine utilization protein EutQ n=1 Tax=Caloramator quimbayensis TaxID=1147123 RepID=A0A1T4WG49_9CLOT|nr:cupin domain-containing protein [Caloramator quimbayensis]SKA75948.1 ethanolamine utilization protein EutQ [Caloramator quimbayensis]